MSLPNPVEQKSYYVINNKLSRVMKVVVEESMKRAAVAENSSSPDNLITISGDGTWKTREHSSLIGVCTVIGAETDGFCAVLFVTAPHQVELHHTNFYTIQSIAKLPTGSPKMMTTWLYHQHFDMFPLHRHYKVAVIRDISRSCLDPNNFTVHNCIVKGHASLSPPSLRLRLCSRFSLLAT
ncbi:hypothetical protein TNCV_3086571 [Trichonephila clavipes]|nr:hypothetical protein TNCV_3086571 [Trichonephila clavipes]